MKKYFLFLYVFFCYSQLSAHEPPYPGYWQQEVAYNIKASLDDKTDIIDGSETLTYKNNSPDRLDFVFFHLYLQNIRYENLYCFQFRIQHNIFRHMLFYFHNTIYINRVY